MDIIYYGNLSQDFSFLPLGKEVFRVRTFIAFCVLEGVIRKT